MQPLAFKKTNGMWVVLHLFCFKEYPTPLRVMCTLLTFSTLEKYPSPHYLFMLILACQMNPHSWIKGLWLLQVGTFYWGTKCYRRRHVYKNFYKALCVNERNMYELVICCWQKFFGSPLVALGRKLEMKAHTGSCLLI